MIPSYILKVFNRNGFAGRKDWIIEDNLIKTPDNLFYFNGVAAVLIAEQLVKQELCIRK